MEDPKAHGTAPSESKNETIAVPTDHDVLCGRGKGPRMHPGNAFYYRLLRETYPEYKSARTGVKALLIKKIVSLVREQNGRFLERQKVGNTWVYSNIGEERALMKTSQAMRDTRTTVKQQDSSIAKNRSQHRPKPKPKLKEEEKKPPSSIITRSDPPRRPTYQERLAMLERERNDNQSSSSDENTEVSKDEDDEISDTESEDSSSYSILEF